jgi:hypothetical protein
LFFKKWKKEQPEIIDKYLKGYHLVLSLQRILQEEREKSAPPQRETEGDLEQIFARKRVIHLMLELVAYLSDAYSEEKKGDSRFLFGEPTPSNPFYGDVPQDQRIQFFENVQQYLQEFAEFIKGNRQ